MVLLGWEVFSDKLLDDGGYGGPLSVEIEFDDKGWPAIPEVNQAAITAYRNLIQLLEPHW
jgi:hypothetical protein